MAVDSVRCHHRQQNTPAENYGQGESVMHMKSQVLKLTEELLYFLHVVLIPMRAILTFPHILDDLNGQAQHGMLYIALHLKAFLNCMHLEIWVLAHTFCF